MRRKTLLLSAPLGLGALVLLWTVLAARSEPGSKPARPARKVGAAQPAASVEVPTAVAPSAGDLRSTVPTVPAGGGGENALIEERIRKMEERLQGLEAKRSTLAGANQDLELRLGEKHAELSARVMAEWRVRNWEQFLDLSEAQKQVLLEMATRWTREDVGKPASRDAWLGRESDLRSRLSVEQAAKLHDSAVSQSRQLWNNLGRTIGSMVGASKEDQARFQQALGDYRPEHAMLLPESCGADWPSMMRDSFSRLQPMLSSDQMSKLNKFVQK